MAALVTDRLATAVLCVFMVFGFVKCMNFDARFSVIKKGKENSYFGFSVAQHQYETMEEGQNTKVKHNILFVGAPKESRTIESTLTGGSLYNCSAQTSSETDCTLITAVDPYKFKTGELVDDQWLGVTVASGGPNKKLVGCAHRYIKDNAATGQCTLLYAGHEFEYDSTLSPCSKWPNTNFMTDFGLCQGGMSTATGKDDALLMGAPGSVFWQGSIFATNISEATGSSTVEKISPYVSKGQEKENQQPSPTQPYSYNGYAVAMGRFNGTKTLFYVSGAPKAYNKGEVVFFTATRENVLYYNASHIIRGNMEFSGYGSSLLAVDLNNDGFDDLIVGAPYFYMRNYGGAFYVYLGSKNMITSDTPVTEVKSREMTEKECKELGCEHARFGMSLASVGDINEDGFQDFAVGAPFEGQGAVYIYHGSDAKEGFNMKFVQRITAKDLPLMDIGSFGYSLSGGMDLDNNGYPDLLVGAYESDAIALIRSRPLVKLSATITVSPTAIDLDSEEKCTLQKVPVDRRIQQCIQITLCLSYNSSISLKPSVLYALEAEPGRALTRVQLLGALDENERIIKNKKLDLSSTGDTCATEIALMKDQTQFEDKLNPMNFQFTFGLETDLIDPEPYPRSSVQKINEFPYLATDGADPSQVNSKTAQVDFVKECGPDNKCYSNLQFDTELTNLTKNEEEGLYELIISNANILYVDISVWNEDEPAYLTKVYLQIPVNVTLRGTDSVDDVTCGKYGDDKTMIVCDRIGNPLRKDKMISFTVRLNVPKDYAEHPELIHTIKTWVNTSSTERTPINDEHVLKFRVINKAEVYLGTNVVPDSAILCKGEPRGASAMKDETSIGAAVTHNFFVSNSGPGVVSRSYISIKWPYEVAGAGGAGKHLLYLMRMPKITGNVEMCNDDDIRKYVNPLKIKEVITPEASVGASSDPVYTVNNGNTPIQLNITGAGRRKRDVPSRSKRAAGNVLIMSCQDETARCFEYKCKLGKLESTSQFVKISMEARLWESTLLSDYRKVESVEIVSWAQLHVPDEIVQSKLDDSRRAITRAIPDFQESAGGKIQWWIILVAVLVGLVVLLVLIFILYKMGFFKRKRMEDMQMYKAEKKNQAMLQDYKDDGI